MTVPSQRVAQIAVAETLIAVNLIAEPRSNVAATLLSLLLCFRIFVCEAEPESQGASSVQ